MNVFASGTWRDEKAEKYAHEARRLGEILAERKHSLITGPGTGISKHIIDGYRAKNGKEIFVFLPAKKFMDAAGEKVLIKADEIIGIVWTNMDYPEKNLLQVREADAIIMITGGPGTLTEIINAVQDYGKPVAVLDGSGEAIIAVKSFPELAKKIFFSEDVEKLVSHIESRLK